VVVTGDRDTSREKLVADTEALDPQHGDKAVLRGAATNIECPA
jgi:hypothetical protein